MIMNKTIRRITVGVALALSAFSLAPAVFAQQSIVPKIYPLTNGLSGAAAFGYTNGAYGIPGGASSNILSQPFQIWRGRGFAFHAGFWTTNASGSNACFNLRFATVHPTNWNNGQGLVTNWSTWGNIALIVPNNGTTEQFVMTNIPASLVDNYQLGQLYSATNGHLSTLFLDPTNTFIGVYP